MGRNSLPSPSKVQPDAKAEKLFNPAARFDKPTEIVRDAKLSQGEKETALDTWEQDARQLMTASNEGMPGKQEGELAGDHHRMGEVRRAKSKIGAKSRHKSSH